MQELSLNILDVANNSVRANATLIEIFIREDITLDKMTIKISDNGCGMSEEQLKSVTDPFFTTRTTRKIGLGVPFFKMAALLCSGDFKISSKEREGTVVEASFMLSHVDRMPLGDISSTYCILAGSSKSTDVVYTHMVGENTFTADTREFKEILGDIPLSSPQVMEFIKSFINENLQQIYL